MRTALESIGAHTCWLDLNLFEREKKEEKVRYARQKRSPLLSLSLSLAHALSVPPGIYAWPKIKLGYGAAQCSKTPPINCWMTSPVAKCVVIRKYRVLFRPRYTVYLEDYKIQIRHNTRKLYALYSLLRNVQKYRIWPAHEAGFDFSVLLGLNTRWGYYLKQGGLSTKRAQRRILNFLKKGQCKK